MKHQTPFPESERKKNRELLDRVLKEGTDSALGWLCGAFNSHEESIHFLRQDLQELRKMLLYALPKERLLSVHEAQILKVCRICRDSVLGEPKDGLREIHSLRGSLILNYGEEFAHESCLLGSKFALFENIRKLVGSHVSYQKLDELLVLLGVRVNSKGEYSVFTE